MSLSLEQASGGSFVFSKAGTAIGSTVSQLATGAATVYTIDGVFAGTKAATASIPLTPATGYALNTVPIGSKAAIGLWLDAAGNFTVTQGAISQVGSAAEKVSPPPNPGARALVGVATVFAGTAAFVPATTAFNAAGVTTAYFDTATLPSAGF